MAWYEIKATCGHIFRKQLYGKISGRESYVQWAENNLLCPDCYQKELDDKKELEYKEAIKVSEEENLPNLEGTEKQIKWAVILRKNQLNVLYKLIGEALSTEDKEYAEYLKERVEIRKKETSAVFFIDRRNNGKDNFRRYFKEKQLENKGKEFVNN